MTGARKKTGPRCRTIGGVVYDLQATDRKPPCGRGRPSSGPSSPPRASSPPKAPAAPKQPDVSAIIYTFEPTATGGGYNLIASTSAVAKVLATYGTRDEAADAAREARKTGIAPAPKKREPGAWEQGKFARARRSGVVSNDLRVIERQERERAHEQREQREREQRNRLPPEVEDAIARGVLPDEAEQRRRHARLSGFGESAPERSTLADAGRLPKRPALNASERDILKAVRKRNAAGLFYHSGHHSPNVQRQFVALVERGELKEGGPYLFLLPEYEGKGLRSMAGKPGAAPPAPAPPAPPKRERPSRSGKPKLPKLPSSLGTPNELGQLPLLKVGDLVSYATPGTSVSTLGTVELEYGIVTDPPNYGASREVDQRPTVKFVDPAKLEPALRSMLPDRAYASQPGFSRHLPMSKLYFGWLAPQRGWHKPKGFL